MVTDKPILFYAYNTIIFLMGITIVLFLHYFDVQDKMYVKISKLENQMGSMIGPYTTEGNGCPN